MKIIIPLSIAAAMLLPNTSVHSQNLILNGSFEHNTATGNTLNLTSAWASVVSDCFEVDGGSMDLITGNNCGSASDGNWFVTCSPVGGLWPYLAFSFKLSTTLIQGAQYTLTFDKRFCGPNTSPIDVGISSDSTLLGTVFHTFAAPLVNTWATETYIFQAPVAGQYLTANIGAAFSTGTVGLDRFSLEAGVTGISDPPMEHLILFPNPCNGIFTVSVTGTASERKIEIYNSIGAVVYHTILTGQKAELDFSGRPRGIYAVKIHNGVKSCMEKIIIQ